MWEKWHKNLINDNGTYDKTFDKTRIILLSFNFSYDWCVCVCVCVSVSSFCRQLSIVMYVFLDRIMIGK